MVTSSSSAAAASLLRAVSVRPWACPIVSAKLHLQPQWRMHRQDLRAGGVSLARGVASLKAQTPKPPPAKPEASWSTAAPAAAAVAALVAIVGFTISPFARAPDNSKSLLPKERHASATAAGGSTSSKPPSSSSSQEAGKSGSSNLPLYTRGEVAEHASPETGIWVTYGSGVYDISEFVAIHPGGERILLAAGQAIDPFWAVFSIHGTPETRELLEAYRIGDLVPRADDPTAAACEARATGVAVLFANEPERHPSLVVRSERPCNAEAQIESLEPFVTPNERFFVRNHLPVPATDSDSLRLEIEGPGIPDGFALSLHDLVTKFPHTSIAVTLQCAGNRRREMHEVRPVKGLQWTQGAISNAVWTGVRLRDVLAHAGYAMPDFTAVQADTSHFRDTERDATPPVTSPDGVAHVHFDGAEGYGASIPIDKAIDPRGDVIIAFAMNGEPIPRDHGFPLRAIVPGHVAARSVKWLNRIALSDEESPSHWQQRDYKGFSPSATLETSDYSKSVSIQELPVQSAITWPKPGDQVAPNADGSITVKGYSVSGGGNGILRVDVSTDGGYTWTDAQMLRKPNQPSGREWAWTQWEARVPVSTSTDTSASSSPSIPTGKDVQLVCKAVDSSYNSQPETFESIYNARGVLVTAWHRVNVHVKSDTSNIKNTPSQ